jgi:protein SCO1/2
MRKAVPVFAAIFLFLALGAWLWMRQSPRSVELISATALSEPRPAPEFSLTDQDQRPFTRAQLRGQWSLVFFGFTSCPDVCPTTLTLMHAARAQLAQDKSLPPLKLIFVSVDPQRDPPQRIGPYVHSFDAGFVGATGPLPQLEILTNALYVPFVHTPNASGGYNVDHSGALVLINPEAGAVAYFSPPHRLQDVVHDLAAIMGGGKLRADAQVAVPPPAPVEAHEHHHE